MSDTIEPHIPSTFGGPAWEVAKLFPPQGQWSESDFFRIHTNQMAELVNGTLEILPMPNWLHQLIVIFLLDGLRDYLKQKQLGGSVQIAPLPTKLFPGTIREPDVFYVSPKNVPRDPTGYPDKLDLVFEVVSSGKEAHDRDYDAKRIDYAKAGISEYWIVDPDEKQITVLGLDGNSYLNLGVFRQGETAQSRYLDGFSIKIDSILALVR